MNITRIQIHVSELPAFVARGFVEVWRYGHCPRVDGDAVIVERVREVFGG